ncbi:MAG TPA: glutaminyl-peptide cyclotransferase [bacterium]|nr:glutaminyl-peptide cyclotransferase [bacterium]
MVHLLYYIQTMKNRWLWLFLSLPFFYFGIRLGLAGKSDPPDGHATMRGGMVPLYTYQIIHRYPHDPNAFTQGLYYQDGFLYEGTGLYRYSSLRKVNLETGEVVRIHHLPDEYFGEGITLFNHQIHQLTWLSKTGFVYDAETFAPLREFHYGTEGWGLTHDGKRLIMSDGSSTLYFRDPATFDEISRVTVRDATRPITRLNELEYVRGEIFANIWETDFIARISPGTGQVTGWIDLTGLLSPEDLKEPVDVLNGIAYDEAHDRLFVTGKLWPVLFEIDLIPVQSRVSAWERAR